MNPTPKRALVTGGSGDLGGAICRQLAADGIHVIVHANSNVERAQTVVDAIAGAGGSAAAVAFDVADGDATRAALETLLANGPIQVVVNNAGIHDDAPMAGMSDAQWKRVIDVSLHGFFHVTQPLLLPMARTRWAASSAYRRSRRCSAIAVRPITRPPSPHCTAHPDHWRAKWRRAASR